MHTSGITVDEAVAGEFAAAKDDASVLYMQYRIINDRFQRTGTGKRTASRSADFLALQSALSPTEPSFLIAHPTPQSSSSSADKWLLLFYMPAAASVRDRMVYSSSTSALRDGLGSAAFLPATWNLTDRSYCTEEEWTEHGRQLTDADMMTNDEIAAKEAETSSSLSMSSSRVNAIVGLPVRLADGSMERLRALKSMAGHSLLLRLDGETEMLSVEEEGDWSFEEAANKLPAGEPRYLLSNFEHQYNGQQEQAISQPAAVTITALQPCCHVADCLAAACADVSPVLLLPRVHQAQAEDVLLNLQVSGGAAAAGAGRLDHQQVARGVGPSRGQHRHRHRRAAPAGSQQESVQET